MEVYHNILIVYQHCIDNIIVYTIMKVKETTEELDMDLKSHAYIISIRTQTIKVKELVDLLIASGLV